MWHGQIYLDWTGVEWLDDGLKCIRTHQVQMAAGAYFTIIISYQTKQQIALCSNHFPVIRFHFWCLMSQWDILVDLVSLITWIIHILYLNMGCFQQNKVPLNGNFDFSNRNCYVWTTCEGHLPSSPCDQKLRKMKIERWPLVFANKEQV